MDWVSLLVGIVMGTFFGVSLARARSVTEVIEAVGRRLSSVQEGQIAEISLTFTRDRMGTDVAVRLDDDEDDGESWRRN